MMAGPVWSMCLFIFEWATRAPVLVDMSVPMTGKHVIITGGCGGMGEELATIMVAAGASVVLGCRDLIKADAAVERIRAASARSTSGVGQLHGEVDHMHLDLASFKSVRHFASEYAENYKRLDVLVNNAGTAVACASTEDGNEHAFQVNYLSHFLLTQLLMPTLQDSKSSRIVHVTCPAAERAGALPERGIWGWLWDLAFGSGEVQEAGKPIDVSNLDGLGPDGQGRCSPTQQYAMSKLAVIAASHELHLRLNQIVDEDDDELAFEVTSIALDPGDLASDFLSKGPKTQARQSMRSRMLMMFPPFRLMAWMTGGLFNTITSSMMRSINRGARCNALPPSRGPGPRSCSMPPAQAIAPLRQSPLSTCTHWPGLASRMGRVPDDTCACVESVATLTSGECVLGSSCISRGKPRRCATR